MKLTAKKKHYRKFSKNWKLPFFLTVLCYSLTSTATIKAETINTTILFQPPPESEQPDNTDSAASRSGTLDGNKQCFQDFVTNQDQKSTAINQSIIPIVPKENYGLTLKERPTFWVYLPKTSAQQIILSVREEGAKPHWQQSINLTNESGIIGIKLAEDAPVLEVGKNYQWAVVLVCENRPNPNDPVVTSWIKRIDKSSVDSSQIASSELKKAANYAEKGIWYDALDILITEKSSIDNWQNVWSEYLQSGGLTEIANEPIINNK